MAYNPPLVLKLKKSGCFGSYFDQNGMLNDVSQKYGKLPKTCTHCSLLTFSVQSNICTNCRRFNKKDMVVLDSIFHENKLSEMKPKIRPFEVNPTTSHIPRYCTISLPTDVKNCLNVLAPISTSVNAGNTQYNSSFSINANPLDDFLKTGRFVEYLKQIHKYLPDYTLDSTIIKLSTDSLSIQLSHSLDEGEFSIISCAIMTYRELLKHVVALRVEHVQRWCRPILGKLMFHPKNLNGIFNVPVDLDGLDIRSSYLSRVPHPIDLGTIRSRLHRGVYDSVQKCMADIELTFVNASNFNPPENIIHQIATQLRDEFRMEISLLDDKCSKEVTVYISSIFS